MKIDSNSQTTLRHVLPMVVLVISAAACAEPSGTGEGEDATRGSAEDAPRGESPTGHISMASISGTQVTPQNQQQQMALQAIEATEVVQVLSLLSGNLAVNPQGLTVNAVSSKAIQKAQMTFGSSCVHVQSFPGASPVNRTVTFTYDHCSGPFQHVTIDGTSTTTFDFDVVKQAVTIETTDDLSITKGGQATPITSTRTGTLDTDGLALSTQVDFVDFAGEPRSLSGTLDVSVDPQTGCVKAAIGPGQTQGAATLEISDLSVCMDGNVCVGAVDFQARKGAVALKFDQGQVQFHVSDPMLPNDIDASLPISIPSCVNVIH